MGLKPRTLPPPGCRGPGGHWAIESQIGIALVAQHHLSLLFSSCPGFLPQLVAPFAMGDRVKWMRLPGGIRPLQASGIRWTLSVAGITEKVQAPVRVRARVAAKAVST